MPKDNQSTAPVLGLLRYLHSVLGVIGSPEYCSLMLTFWSVRNDFDVVLFTITARWILNDEWNFWTDPPIRLRNPADSWFFAIGTKDGLALLAEQTVRFQQEQEIPPEIVLIGTIGHALGNDLF